MEKGKYYKVKYELFPFGYGLSYTTFEYSNINLATKNDGYEVTFDLKNSGKIKVEETAQIYVASASLSMNKPVKELKGFSKVMLNAGESKQVKVKLNQINKKCWSAVLQGL